MQQHVQVHPPLRATACQKSATSSLSNVPILGAGIGAFQTQNGLPPRSTAQVTRVSSMGRTRGRSA